MLAGDIDGNAMRVICENPDVDLLLWDITDDRMGLIGDSPSNKWTLASYHYGPDYYRYLAEQFAKLTK